MNYLFCFSSRFIISVSGIQEKIINKNVIFFVLSNIKRKSIYCVWEKRKRRKQEYNQYLVLARVTAFIIIYMDLFSSNHLTSFYIIFRFSFFFIMFIFIHNTEQWSCWLFYYYFFWMNSFLWSKYIYFWIRLPLTIFNWFRYPYIVSYFFYALLVLI